MNPDARSVIEKFWAGTATPAEQQQLLSWLDAEESAGRLVIPDDGDEAANPAAAPTDQLSPEQAARVLRRLHWRLALDAAPAATPTPPATPRPRLWAQARRARWAVGALVVLVLALVLGWWLTQRPAAAPPLARQVAPPVPQVPDARRATGLSGGSGSAFMERTNAGPAPLRLPLPDGSVVTLDAHSTLTYLSFGPASRALNLRGAALFEVKKDPARPFTVEAGGFTTTALGTRFRVVSRAEHRVTVRLLAGRVVVRTIATGPFAMQPQYLTPGRELRADARTQEVRVGAFDSVAAAPRAAGVVHPRPPARNQTAATARLPPATATQGPAVHPPLLLVWVCTWCKHTYTSPQKPTSFEPDKCSRNPGKAHAWHQKYPDHK